MWRMKRRGWIAAGVGAAAAIVGVSGFAIDEHQVTVKPPAVSGSVTLRAVRNTDPRAKQFLDDVKRAEYRFLAMPGTFVEATIRWHPPHRLDPGKCQVAVHILPQGSMRLGAISTGSTGNVGMGDDSGLKEAFHEPGPATWLGGISYTVAPTATDGTITFLVMYPDNMPTRFDGTAARALSVVECTNHGDLSGRTRQLAGPVSTMAVSQSS